MTGMFPRMGLVVVLSLLTSSQSVAQDYTSRSDSHGSIDKWLTSCESNECLMRTEILRGDSGDPADSGDSRNYIGISIALDKAARQLDYVELSVDPRATQHQGIFIGFVKSIKKGNDWNMQLDDGALPIPLVSCTKVRCLARVSKGTNARSSTGMRINILSKFLVCDGVLILYVENGKAYRTMIPLDSFHRDYQKIFARDVTPSQPHPPHGSR